MSLAKYIQDTVSDVLDDMDLSDYFFPMVFTNPWGSFRVELLSASGKLIAIRIEQFEDGTFCIELVTIRGVASLIAHEIVEKLSIHLD